MRRIAIALGFLVGILPLVAVFAQAPPAVPALPDTERRTSYALSSSTCACSVGFQLFQDGSDIDSWIEVWINGSRILSNSATSGWTITSATGTLNTIPRPITNAVLTFTSPQTGTLQIVGAARPRRLSQFAENRGVAARDLNQALTTIIAQNREIWDKTNDVTGRSIVALPGETMAPLPATSSRANKILIFDGTGNPTVTAPASSGANMLGPTSSAVGDLVLWNSTNGTLVKDGGLTLPTSIQDNITRLGTVTTNQVWNGDQYFKSGRPWCDVRAQGAVGDGVTNDTSAFTSCISSLISSYGGGTVYVPPSANPYCVFGVNINTGLTTNGDIQIIGAGTRYSALSACGNNTFVFQINNQFITFRGLAIYGYGMRSTDAVFTGTSPSAATIIALSGASFCRFQDLYVAGGTQTIQLQANGCVIDNVTAQFAYGDGTNGNAIVYIINSGSYFRNSHFDQVWPQSQPAHGATIAARGNTTGYSLGAVVTITCNARIFLLQATSAGTSGGSPPTCKVYGQALTDGSVVWQLVGPQTYYGVQIDTGANENYFHQVDMTGSFSAGMALTNTFSLAAPQATGITDSTIGGTVNQGILASSGSGLVIQNTEVSRCVAAGCAAFQFSGNWSGSAIVANSRVINNVSYGILSSAGTDLVVSNNIIKTADVLSISMAPATSAVINFNIINNMVTSTGITIGTSVWVGSRFTVLGNNCNGAAFLNASSSSNTYPTSGAAMNAANCF